MGRTLEERGEVLLRQMRREPGDPGQVQAAVGEHDQEHREPARGPRHADAQVRFGLRQIEYFDTVSVHRRAAFTEIEPARVDFGDVSDNVGVDPAVLLEERGEPPEELVIGERKQSDVARHSPF